MRVLLSLVLTVIMAGGAMAGVLAGKAVAGGNAVPKGTGVSGVRDIGLPSEGPVQGPHTPLTNEFSGRSTGAQLPDQTQQVGRQPSFNPNPPKDVLGDSP